MVNTNRTYKNIIKGIEAHMISLCLDYSEYEADGVYINCSIRKFMDGDVFSNDHFYVVSNEVVGRGELSKYIPSVLDSYENQAQVDNLLMDDFMEIVTLYEKSDFKMPTEIRIIYNNESDELIVENSFEELILEKVDEPDYVVNRWMKEVKESMNK